MCRVILADGNDDCGKSLQRQSRHHYHERQTFERSKHGRDSSSVLVLCGKSLVNMLRLRGIDTWRAWFPFVVRAFLISKMSRSTFRDYCLYLE
jgi:hypothetical protein